MGDGKKEKAAVDADFCFAHIQVLARTAPSVLDAGLQFLAFDAPLSLQLGWLPPVLPAISRGLVQVNWIHAGLESRRRGEGFHPKWMNLSHLIHLF